MNQHESVVFLDAFLVFLTLRDFVTARSNRAQHLAGGGDCLLYVIF